MALAVAAALDLIEPAVADAIDRALDAAPDPDRAPGHGWTVRRWQWRGAVVPTYASRPRAPAPPPDPCCSTCRCRAGRGTARPTWLPPAPCTSHRARHCPASAPGNTDHPQRLGPRRPATS